MARFRKKPVEINAFRLGVDKLEWPMWFVAHVGSGKVTFQNLDHKTFAKIDTLEGVMTAHPGDWIIEGVAGEIYPCKPEIFDATYETA